MPYGILNIIINSITRHKKMSASGLVKIRKIVADTLKKQQLSRDELLVDMSSSNFNPAAEQHVAERTAFIIAIADHEQRIKELASTLTRIDAGQFGYCLECGHKMAIKELKLNICTEYCSSCKESKERLNQLIGIAEHD